MSWIIAVPFFALWAHITLLALVGRAASSSRAGRVLTLYLGILSVSAFSSWMIHLGMLPGPDFWLRILMSAGVAICSLMVCFATEFPRPKLRWLTPVWSLLGFSALALVWTGLVASEAYLVPGGQGAVRAVFGPLMLPVALYGLMSGCLSIVLFVSSMKTSTSASERVWIAYALSGSVVFVLGSFTNLIPAVGQYPIDILATLLNAFLISFATLRHRFLDVVIKKGVIYSALTAVISVIYLVTVFLFTEVFRSFTGYNSMASAVVVALLVSVIYRPLRELLQTWVDRLFARASEGYRKILQQFSQSMTAVLSVDELADTTVEVISKALYVSKVALLLLDEVHGEFLVWAARGVDVGRLPMACLQKKSNLGSWLSGENLLLGTSEVGSSKELRRLLLSEVNELDVLEPEILVPIRTRGLLLGVLILGPKLSGEPYLDEDRELLSTFANQAAIAIENARLYEGTKEKLEQLASLHKISLAIASRLDLEELLQSVLEQALQLARAERVALFLRDGEGRKLTVEASEGWPKEVQQATLVSDEGSIASQVARTQQPLLLQSGSFDLVFDEERIARGIKDAIGVPLKVENRVVGVLEVANKAGEGTFTDNDLQMLSLLANHAAIAINDARLYQDLHARMKELEQTQAQLIQSVKLATVGEMAATVAHEINNPLGGILGFTELLLEETEDSDPRREDLGAIKAETVRARDIIRSWLGFARQSEEQREEVGLNEVLRETVDLLRHHSELAGVRISEEYGADLPKVEAHSNQMKQVFLNILNNALFAMPEGGNLRIKTCGEGSWVTVRLEDTGLGISKENLGKIFDPFFSTKPEPKGTGLGLSVSQSIVYRHGGVIAVASEVGRGTAFTVKLPALGQNERRAEMGRREDALV